MLSRAGSADFLLTRRKSGENPFLPYNVGAKVGQRLATRLETFVFTCADIDRYAAIQKGNGVRFLTPEVIRTPNYDFIQTAPSAFTGNSIGLVRWKHRGNGYVLPGGKSLPLELEKPDARYLANIGRLDHVATRVKAQDRDPAILEFMSLTNYNFDFAVYVESLNSITNVARLSRDDYAQVFTSGITPFTTPKPQAPLNSSFITGDCAPTTRPLPPRTSTPWSKACAGTVCVTSPIWLVHAMRGSNRFLPSCPRDLPGHGIHQTLRRIRRLFHQKQRHPSDQGHGETIVGWRSGRCCRPSPNPFPPGKIISPDPLIPGVFSRTLCVLEKRPGKSGCSARMITPDGNATAKRDKVFERGSRGEIF